MSGQNNPTALSATYGKQLRFGGLVKNLIMPAVLLAFAAYLGVGIVTMTVPDGTRFPGPGFFPGLIATGLAVFAVLLIVRALRAPHQEPSGDGSGVGLDWASFAWIVAGFGGFIALLPVLGWIIGAGLLFWAMARGFGERRYLRSLIIGLTASSLVYIAFDMALGMSLPSGILGWGF
jgi:putative tricarboxylic transport membrane protein